MASICRRVIIDGTRLRRCRNWAVGDTEFCHQHPEGNDNPHQNALKEAFLNVRITDDILQAVRYAARQPCKRSNCGTVCLCGPCHARRALPFLEK